MPSREVLPMRPGGGGVRAVRGVPGEGGGVRASELLAAEAGAAGPEAARAGVSAEGGINGRRVANLSP
jgi:hypothetical protein